MTKDLSDVSVIICTRNNCENIKTVIESVVSQQPKEIIVVDGNSTDGTREIVENLPVTMVTDPGKGLAMARQIGLEESTGDYVFYCGDDNIIPNNAIIELKKYLESHDIVCAGMLTRVKNCDRNYWAFGSDMRWQTRIYEGEREVVGTPNMYYRSVLEEIGWNTDLKFSDDTDLQERMCEKYKIAYSNVCCYEIGKTDFLDIKKRFKMYGVSDAEFWNGHHETWKVGRKIRSILHPIRDELIRPMSRVKGWGNKIRILPFFVIITWIRYCGWVTYKNKGEKHVKQ